MFVHFLQALLHVVSQSRVTQYQCVLFDLFLFQRPSVRLNNYLHITYPSTSNAYELPLMHSC